MLRVLLVLLVILGSLPPSLSYGHDCEQDSLCWHDFPLNSLTHVGEFCMDMVEIEASREFPQGQTTEWDLKADGLGVVFSKVRWIDKTKRILQYWGDNLVFRDANGQQISMEYTCDYGFNDMKHFKVQVIEKEESKIVR